MTRSPDDGLRSALRSLRVPEAPDPEALLARALPEPSTRRNGGVLTGMTLAALVLATLPLWMPSPTGSEAWTEGLVQRSTVFADGLLDRLGRNGP